MNRFAKAAIITLAGFAATAVPMAQAYADHWRPRHHDGGGVIIRRDRNNDALAAGIIGLAAGAIIGGALSQPRPVYQPRRIYREVLAYDAYPDAPPAPRYQRVVRYSDSIEPWTRDWYRYCSDRYRSFNPETGTFRGYDGRNHFCQVN